MGTSRSSTGPGSGVPLVPDWLDRPPGAPPPPAIPPDLASPNRFGPARRQFSRYVDDGDRDSLRSGLSSYVNQGYGSSQTASERMAQAASTAARSYSVLSSVSGGGAAAAALGFDPASLVGLSIRDLIGKIVDAVRPSSTTHRRCRKPARDR
jgi:hypothetical protein